MKKAFYLVILSLISSFAGFAQSATPYKGTLSVTIASPSIADGQASYRAEVDLSALRLSPAQMVELTPVVRSSDGMRQERFAPVIVMGKQRARIVDREKRLNGYHWSVEPSQVIVLKDRSARRTHIEASVPYQDWMQDASLTVVEKTLTGDDAPQRYGSGLYSYTHSSSGAYQSSPLSQATASKPAKSTRREAYRPEFRIANVVIPSKTRTESYTARITFAQNNSLINRTLGDNAVVLSETDERIRAIQNDPLRTITAITVKGYASPEGEVASNRNLAADRARTFVNYIGNVHNLRSPGVRVTATGIGEDWNGLRDMVEGSTMDDRYRILDALDNYADVNQRRTALQELNSGVTYVILLNYYSILRRAEYTIEYTVQESGSAAESFDAAQEIRNGNYDGVIARLDGMNTPQALNDLGICYWCKGDYARSSDYFRRAADAGSGDAQENLRQYNLWSEGRK